MHGLLLLLGRPSRKLRFLCGPQQPKKLSKFSRKLLAMLQSLLSQIFQNLSWLLRTLAAKQSADYYCRKVNPLPSNPGNWETTSLTTLPTILNYSQLSTLWRSGVIIFWVLNFALRPTIRVLNGSSRNPTSICVNGDGWNYSMNITSLSNINQGKRMPLRMHWTKKA